jgi:hypothetical protein
MYNLFKAILISTLMGPAFTSFAVEDDFMAAQLGISVDDYRRGRELEAQHYASCTTSVSITISKDAKLTHADLDDIFELTLGISTPTKTNSNYRCEVVMRPNQNSREQIVSQQINNDMLIAQALGEKLYGGISPGGYIIDPLIKTISKEDDKNYELIVTASRNIKHNSDVYTITQTFARPHHGTLKFLETKYMGILNKKPALSLDEIEKIINRLYQRNYEIEKLKEPISQVLAKIRTYWPSPVDIETGIDITKVMSDTFVIAEVYGDAALENLCLTLADNTQTNGGCHPGVTGRLAYMFFVFVSSALERGKRS